MYNKQIANKQIANKLSSPQTHKKTKQTKPTNANTINGKGHGKHLGFVATFAGLCRLHYQLRSSQKQFLPPHCPVPLTHQQICRELSLVSGYINPLAARANQHNLGGFSNRKSFSHSLSTGKLMIKVWQCSMPGKGSLSDLWMVAIDLCT